MICELQVSTVSKICLFQSVVCIYMVKFNVLGYLPGKYPNTLQWQMINIVTWLILMVESPFIFHENNKSSKMLNDIVMEMTYGML